MPYKIILVFLLQLVTLTVPNASRTPPATSVLVDILLALQTPQLASNARFRNV